MNQTSIPVDYQDPFYRKVPHNIEAEQCVLGSILLRNEIIYEFIDKLEPEHFFDPLHGRIYQACKDLIQQERLIDQTTLSSFFLNEPPVGPLSVSQYLGKLVTFGANLVSASECALLIQDLCTRRSLILLGEDLTNDSYNVESDVPSEAIIQNIESKLFSLSQTGGNSRKELHIADAVHSALTLASIAHNNEKGTVGVPTGLTDIDNRLGGFMPSDLIILAGRPAMGKTSLAVNMARHQASTAYPVGFFSLEMSGEQIAQRIIADLSDVSSSDIRLGRASQDDFEKLYSVSDQVCRYPIYIDDTGGLSIEDLSVRARRMKRLYDIHVLYVDYLQLLRSDKNYGSNRVQEITQITMGLKALAKNLDIPVVALSQLSRAVETRDNKRPILADLRESGSIEQDADIVIFLFREEYYIEKDKPARFDVDKLMEWEQKISPVRNLAEAIVAKHRTGATENIKLGFTKKFMRFFNLSDRG